MSAGSKGYSRRWRSCVGSGLFAVSLFACSSLESGDDRAAGSVGDSSPDTVITDARQEDSAGDTVVVDQPDADAGTFVDDDGNVDATDDGNVDATIDATNDARVDADDASLADATTDGDASDGRPDDAPIDADASDARASDGPSEDTPPIVPVCGGPCSETGTMRCNGSTVEICVDVAQCHGWMQIETCGNDSMCCNSACVRVGADHCFGCSAQCNGTTPVCSSVAQACVCTATSCPSNSFWCDPHTGTCRPVEVPVDDYYVDANAAPGGNGSLDQPFRTITAALRAAGRLAPEGIDAGSDAGDASADGPDASADGPDASADGPDDGDAGSPAAAPLRPMRMHVAAGRYDAAQGEIFPIELRGVTLIGAGRDNTIVVGSGPFTFVDPNSNVLTIAQVTMLVGDSSLPTRISGVWVQSMHEMPQGGGFGIVCNGGAGRVDASDGGLGVPDASDGGPDDEGLTVLDALRIGPNLETGIVATAGQTAATGEWTGCRLKLKASEITGCRVGLIGAGCANSSDPPVPVTLDVGGEPAEGNLFTAIRASGNAYALRLGACVTTASVRNNEFAANDYGIYYYYDDSLTALDPMRAVFEHNRLRNHVEGVYLAGSISVDSFAYNTIEGTTDSALTLYYPSTGWMTFKARGNTISNNTNAVYVAAWGAYFDDPAQPPPDFGTASDPGGNVFSCNSYAADNPSADVQLYGYGSGTLPFAGNVWDHAPPTMDVYWGYADGTDIFNYRSYWSVDTSPGPTADGGTDAGAEAGVTAGACAAGHVP